MLFIRGVAIIVGLSAIAAVTYGTIEATGGISTNTAPLYIALGGLQVVIAMLFTHLQSRLAKMVGLLVLLACEAATFIGTADLQLMGIETRAAPVHEAAAKRKAAEDWITRLDGDDRVQRAERALRDAQTDARAKSTAKDCAKGCIATLARTVDDATAAVEQARQSLQLEQRQARAALEHAPLPPQASPLAARLGIEPGTLDLFFVGFRGFAVAAGAAIVLAFGAHSRRRPAETVLVEVEHRAPPKPTADKKRLSVETVRRPTARSEADRFAKAMFQPAPQGRVPVRDIRAAYHSWCVSSRSKPLPDKEIGAALNELFSSVGLLLDGKGADAAIVGIDWRNKQLAQILEARA
jgi:hypothetical protein